jgi:16S rRNA (adenine1518-N6/adenine1519-N6)-dimethyltransferase
VSILGFLKGHGITPDSKLDQNFLADESVIEQLIKTAKLGRDDVILEVGPGTGLLTKRLAKRVKKVVCVEKDYNLFEVLVSIFKNSNVEVVHEDITKFGLKDYKIIVSSLPYSIVDWFFKQLLERDFTKAIVIVSTKSYKKIEEDLLVNSYLNVEKVFDVSRDSFYPVPSVDSVSLIITPKVKSDCSKSEINIRTFYEANKDKCIKDLIKASNPREANRLISDLSWVELKKMFFVK